MDPHLRIPKLSKTLLTAPLLLPAKEMAPTSQNSAPYLMRQNVEHSKQNVGYQKQNHYPCLYLNPEKSLL